MSLQVVTDLHFCTDEANLPTSNVLSMKELEERLSTAEGLRIPAQQLAAAKNVLAILEKKNSEVTFFH